MLVGGNRMRQFKLQYDVLVLEVLLQDQNQQRRSVYRFFSLLKLPVKKKLF